jgi:hypothetical protein
MNADGLFVELNAGTDMPFAVKDRVSIFTTLFSFMQEYRHD